MKAVFSITGTSVLALIFLALFLPTAYQGIKVLLLLVALIGLGPLAIYFKLIWSSETLLACLLFATIGLANSLHGELNDAPGAIRVLTVMTVWPILYGILSAMLNRPDAIRILIATFTLTLLAVLGYSFLFMGNAAGAVPDALFFEFDENIGQRVGFYEGFVRLGLFSIASLLFLVPFWMHYLLIVNRKNRASVFHWVVMVLGMVLVLLTGRKAAQLVVLISPILIVMTETIVRDADRGRKGLFRALFNWRNAAIMIVGASAILAVFFWLELDLGALVDYFISGFKFDDASSPDALARGDQYRSLMQAWFNGNIWFGAGNGSHTDLLRDDLGMPWSYELTYVYLLFSTGVTGVCFYLWWFSWGLLRVRRALIRRPDMFIYVAPAVTGALGLLIGAASNPYFGKFDYLWIIFLPHLLAGAVTHQRMVEPT